MLNLYIATKNHTFKHQNTEKIMMWTFKLELYIIIIGWGSNYSLSNYITQSYDDRFVHIILKKELKQEKCKFEVKNPLVWFCQKVDVVLATMHQIHLLFILLMVCIVLSAFLFCWDVRG